MRLSVLAMVVMLGFSCSEDEPKEEDKTESKDKAKKQSKNAAGEGDEKKAAAGEGVGKTDDEVAAGRAQSEKQQGESVDTDKQLDINAEVDDRMTGPGIRIDVTTKAVWVSGKEAVPIRCKLDDRPCKKDADRLNKSARFSIDAVYREGGKASGLLIIPLQLVLKAEIRRYSKNATNKKQNRKARLRSRRAANTAYINASSAIPFKLLTDIVYTVGKANIYDLRFYIDGVPLKQTLKPEVSDNKG